MNYQKRFSRYRDLGEPATNPFISPPPAAAPPPPPPSDSDINSVRSVSLEEDDASSDSATYPTIATPPNFGQSPDKVPLHNHYYGSGRNYYSSYQYARAAEVPMITNYGVSPAKKEGAISYANSAPSGPAVTDSFVGNTSLRPNTGQTNDEHGGIGSLREITQRLRWMTIASTLSALIWEGFAFPERLIINTWDQPASVVMGGYLAFFCLLLLGVELNAPMRDNFGILYHPLGRATLLMLMSSMCYAIHIAWWEILLTVAFACCSFGYVYAYIKYPEYRRWQDYNDNRIWRDVRTAVKQTTGVSDWADPNTSGGLHVTPNIMKGWRQESRYQETQSLLHQV